MCAQAFWEQHTSLLLKSMTVLDVIDNTVKTCEYSQNMSMEKSDVNKMRNNYWYVA
jgi:hypothetical protein